VIFLRGPTCKRGGCFACFVPLLRIVGSPGRQLPADSKHQVIQGGPRFRPIRQHVAIRHGFCGRDGDKDSGLWLVFKRAQHAPGGFPARSKKAEGGGGRRRERASSPSRSTILLRRVAPKAVCEGKGQDSRHIRGSTFAPKLSSVTGWRLGAREHILPGDGAIGSWFCFRSGRGAGASVGTGGTLLRRASIFGPANDGEGLFGIGGTSTGPRKENSAPPGPPQQSVSRGPVDKTSIGGGTGPGFPKFRTSRVTGGTFFQPHFASPISREKPHCTSAPWKMPRVW